MLMALGQFVFALDTLPYTELRRNLGWRHAETARFGARPASQALGPDSETLAITGAIFPGTLGTNDALSDLEAIGDASDALPLMDGNGALLGYFVLVGMEQGRTHFLPTGEARKVEFSIELRRTG